MSRTHAARTCRLAVRSGEVSWEAQAQLQPAPLFLVAEAAAVPSHLFAAPLSADPSSPVQLRSNSQAQLALCNAETKHSAAQDRRQASELGQEDI
jgi:hypothetical protein